MKLRGECARFLRGRFTLPVYGPYMRNGKQYWRNYHRPIRHPLAKSYMEIQYMALDEGFQPLYKER